MRNTIIILLISLIAASCGKDKYTTNPQITFKSLKPNRARSDIRDPGDPSVPLITLNVTDREGDLGTKSVTEFSKIYIKNLLNNAIDSFPIPDIQSIATKNFNADILINSFDILGGSTSTRRPRTDTLYFEIYVTDFAKNKSNVIRTPEPIYYLFP